MFPSAVGVGRTPFVVDVPFVDARLQCGGIFVGRRGEERLSEGLLAVVVAVVLVVSVATTVEAVVAPGGCFRNVVVVVVVGAVASRGASGSSCGSGRRRSSSRAVVVVVVVVLVVVLCGRTGQVSLLLRPRSGEVSKPAAHKCFVAALAQRGSS